MARTIIEILTVRIIKPRYTSLAMPLLGCAGILLCLKQVHAEDTKHAAQQRLVSLAPHITELIFAVGTGHHIVGTVEFSDYPAEASEITRSDNSNRINYEEIIASGMADERPVLLDDWTSIPASFYLVSALIYFTVIAQEF